MLTRGGRRLLLTEALPESPERVRLRRSPTRRPRILDGVKSLSYAANMLASRLARERGFDEALLVTPHGRVLEAPTSSFFWVKDGAIFTPPLDEHILASITRARVIEVTGALERACTLEDLSDADEAFLASTTREVQPVAAIDEHAFAESGPVTGSAAAARSARGSSRSSTRLKVLTVIGNRPQFIKAAAVSPLLRRAHDEVLVHTGPALRRRAVRRVLRRARSAGARQRARDRARLEHLSDRAHAQRARADPRATSSLTWCWSTGTRTRRSRGRSRALRPGVAGRTCRGRHALV